MSDLYNKEELDLDKEHSSPVPEADGEFALENILAEFGRGAPEAAPIPEQDAPAAEEAPEKPAGKDEEDEDADMRIAQPRTKTTSEDWREITKDLPVLPKAAAKKEKKVFHFPAAFADVLSRREEDKKPEAPRSPAPEVDDPPLVRLEQVMSQTVDSVLEDNDDAILDEPLSVQEHLERAKQAAMEGWQKLEKARRRAEAEDWVEPEPEEKDENQEPEPDLETAMREERRTCKRLRRQLLLAVVPVLALAVLSVMHTWFAGYLPPWWNDSTRVQGLLLAGLLLVSALVVPSLWKGAWDDLRRGQVNCAQAAFVSVLVTLIACLWGAFSDGGQYLPMAAPAALFAWLSLYGRLQTADMHRRMYHLADLGGVPPYAPTLESAGLCKQRGRLDGFYRTAQHPDPQQRAQRLVLPLLLIACTVCSAVVCLGSGRMGEFFWVWSAMLTASLALGLPLTAVLPMHILTRRLGRSGAAVAGWAGLEHISRAKRMVLTDGDLFPSGTVSLNGLKIYGEEVGKVVSYAATMARATRSTLRPIFDQLLSGEGGTVQPIGEIRYYEEGGAEGVIHGESVVMGSAYCMKKLHVTLPRELKVKTGVFLAVDGQLIAIFALKYQPSRNVEWALRALKRNHMELVMGVRSTNITPGLLKRKFGLDVKPIYPTIASRLALSDLTEQRASRADGLLYRDGLMPYAEMVIGSRRCRRVVWVSTIFALLSSLAGFLLSYYLTNSAAYAALSSGYVLLFLLLLLLPIWLLAGLVKFY